MTLEEAVADYIRQNIGRLEQDYSWLINYENLPIMFDRRGGSLLKQNIELRTALHHAWRSAPERRLEIATWYVRNWGGIWANNLLTLQEYATSTEANLIGRKLRGIASWSKVLSIINPDSYAICDARVLSAINSVQILMTVDNPKYFPPLPSRNSLIADVASRHREIIRADHWPRVQNADVYEEYLEMLRKVVSFLGGDVSLQKSEMVLFARSVALARDLLNRPRTGPR